MVNEFLTNAFLSVLTVAVPAVSGFGLLLLRQFLSKIISDGLADEITSRLEDAVYATTQTYVDDLKASGSFDKEAQVHALSMALATLLGSLSQEAKDYIQEKFGDTEAYLTGRIEAEVKRQKLAA